MMSIRGIRKSCESMQEFDLHKLLLCNSGRTLTDLRALMGDYFRGLSDDLKTVVCSDIDAYVQIVDRILSFKGYYKFYDRLGHLLAVIDAHSASLKTNARELESLRAIERELTASRREVDSVRKAVECAKNVVVLLEKNETDNCDFFVRSVNAYALMMRHMRNVSDRYANFRQYAEHRTRHLLERLDRFFCGLSLEHNCDEIVSCLLIYKELNETRKCESLIRSGLVAPEIKRILASKELDADTTLRIVLRDVSKFLHKIMPFIEIVAHDRIRGCDMLPFNVLLNGIYLELDDQFKVNLRTLYSPTDVHSFRKNYEIFSRFYDEFESLFKSPRQLAEYKNHPSYRQKNCFSFDVYLQIVKHEIELSFRTRLNEYSLAIRTHVLADDVRERSQLHLEPSRLLRAHIGQCLDRNYVVFEMFPRFWEFILKLIAEYILWIQQVLPKVQELQTGGGSGDETDFHRVFSFYLSLLSDIDRLTFDFGDFRARCDSEQTIGAKLTPRLVELCQASLRDPIDLMVAYRSKIRSIVVELVSARISLSLKAVSHIPRSYRKTNKDFANNPSDYVSKINGSLNRLIDHCSLCVSNELFCELFNTLFTHICNKLTTNVKEVLESMNQTENSILKLKQSKNQKERSGQFVSSTGTIVTDKDKILLQLKLDVTTIYENLKTKFAQRHSGIDEQLDRLNDMLNS